MKSLIQAVAVVAALVVPVACFAQTAPQTAAPIASQAAGPDEYVQVVQFEEVAYMPAVEQSQPAAVAAPVEAHPAQRADTSGAGGVAGGSSQSGAAFNPASNVGLKSIYQHN